MRERCIELKLKLRLAFYEAPNIPRKLGYSAHQGAHVAGI
jgi:hypothetical protein